MRREAVWKPLDHSRGTEMGLVAGGNGESRVGKMGLGRHGKEAVRKLVVLASVSGK